MKHLLKMSDLSPAELHHILDVAEELKAEQKAGTTPALLKGRSVALMFSKNSPHTRTSFEVGVYPVSYTHLDVYKRQYQHHAASGGAGPCRSG